MNKLGLFLLFLLVSQLCAEQGNNNDKKVEKLGPLTDEDIQEAKKVKTQHHQESGCQYGFDGELIYAFGVPMARQVLLAFSRAWDRTEFQQQLMCYFACLTADYIGSHNAYLALNIYGQCYPRNARVAASDTGILLSINGIHCGRCNAIY